MFSEMFASPNTAQGRGSAKKAGMLFATSALLMSAAATASFAGHYPESTLASQSASLVRACTQLESSALITASECGTLTLSEVVRRKHVLESDDHDG